MNGIKNDNEGLTLEEVEEKIRSANGNPYGRPPDVASYLKYVLKGIPLSTCIEESSAEELQDVHILLTAKVMDGGLCLYENVEGSLLVTAFARLVADRLRDMGFECSPLEMPKRGWMTKDERTEEERRVKLAFIRSSSVDLTEEDITVTFIRTEDGKRVYTASHGTDEIPGGIQATSEVYLHDENSVSVCLIMTWSEEDGYEYRYKWSLYNDNASAEEEIKKEDEEMKQYLVSADCPFCGFSDHTQGRYFVAKGDDGRPISQAQINEAIDDAFDDLQKKHNEMSDCKERIRAW